MNLPTFLFDGNCGFCKHWVSRWKKHTEDRVEYRPFQEASKDFPNIKNEEYLKSSQFINLNGDVFSGAYGVAMLLSHSKKHRWFLFLYKYLRALEIALASLLANFFMQELCRKIYKHAKKEKIILCHSQIIIR